MAADFDITHEVQDHAPVLVLHGELDLSSAPALEDALRNAESSRPQRVVIDLRRLEFIDSTGLHAIIRAHQRAQSEGHQLVLVRGPRQVQRVFELTGTIDSLSFGEPGSDGASDGAGPTAPSVIPEAQRRTHTA